MQHPHQLACCVAPAEIDFYEVNRTTTKYSLPAVRTTYRVMTKQQKKEFTGIDVFNVSPDAQHCFVLLYCWVCSSDHAVCCELCAFEVQLLTAGNAGPDLLPSATAVWCGSQEVL